MDNFDDIPNTGQNRDYIGQSTRSTGVSQPYRAVTELFHGFDHRHAGSSYPKNIDHQGLVFFTRPRMNFSYDNLMQDRHFLPLAVSDDSDDEVRKVKRSFYRAIRVMLDPVCALDEDRGGEGIETDLFDTRQAFMPLLTNTLVEISGFPDISVDTYTSPEGLRKESYAIVDDIADVNNTFDLTANFQNIPGDPISTFFHLWIRYQSNVYTDVMVPYPEMIVENEVDYQTRIWRIVLDSTKKYVKKIGCAHAAFPIASPLGAAYNYSRETPYSEDIDQISIPFRCSGAEYNDPILILEFNETVAMFNPVMGDEQTREDAYIKVPHQVINGFNFKGYPHINTKTMELEWWVSPEDWQSIMGE